MTLKIFCKNFFSFQLLSHIRMHTKKCFSMNILCRNRMLLKKYQGIPKEYLWWKKFSTENKIKQTNKNKRLHYTILSDIENLPLKLFLIFNIFAHTHTQVQKRNFSMNILYWNRLFFLRIPRYTEWIFLVEEMFNGKQEQQQKQ